MKCVWAKILRFSMYVVFVESFIESQSGIPFNQSLQSLMSPAANTPNDGYLYNSSDIAFRQTDQVNLIEDSTKNNSLRCYHLRSLYLLIPILSLITSMYACADFLCFDTLMCMRVAVSIGLVSALVAVFISVRFEWKYRKGKKYISTSRISGSYDV